MFVLGFGGMAGSGKTTAADFVEIESINLDCKPIRISFADPVREQAAKEAGYTDWRIFKNEKHDLYRERCQAIADEGRPGKWVDIMNAKLKEIELEEAKCTDPLFTERLVIIDDVRFQNELELVKAWAGVSVFVFLGTRTNELADGKWRAHESEWMNQHVEAGRPDYDDLYTWLVYNDKDEKTFEKKLLERLDNFCGTNPSRYSFQCSCSSCRIFRADIQVEEMIAGFEDAIDLAQEDPDLSDSSKKDIEDTLTELIEGLESGEISPLDILFNELDDDHLPGDEEDF